MDIASHGRSDVGRVRDHNEDFMLADPALGLFVVCDGMGGHEAGEVAAEIAARTIHRAVSGNRAAIAAPAGSAGPPPERLISLLRSAIEAACSEVFDQGAGEPSKKGMGCTCTALLISGGRAVMGHVGDSRLYLCRGGAVTQLSEDHTFLAEAVKQGLFTPEEAAECAYRNVITRAIGKDRTVLVDTLVFDVVLGDTLLLCSDGLHQYTRDNGELAGLLSAPAPEEIPARLIDVANERGGSDNVTALVVRAAEASASASDTRRSGDVLKSLETLRKLDLMRDLTMAEIVRFKQIFEEVPYAAGAIVVREGEVNDNLFVIVQGAAEVIRGEQSIATLPPGAHFGEMSLLNSRPRSATVRAVEPCRMLTVGRERLYAFLQHDGFLAAKFFWKLASTLSERLDDVLAQQAEQLQQQMAASSGYYSGLYQKPRLS